MKVEILLERANIESSLTRCSQCGKNIHEGSMHEWIITRGECQGAPWEWRMQIYVPWNVVIVHEEECHRKAQWEQLGRERCFEEVSKYWQGDVVRKWLQDIAPHLTIAEEKLRWVHGKWK